MFRRDVLGATAVTALGFVGGCIGQSDSKPDAANETNDGSPTPTRTRGTMRTSTATATETTATETAARPTDAGEEHTETEATASETEAEPTETEMSSGSAAFADISVSRRAVTVTLAEEGSISQLSLAYGQTVVLRRQIGVDQATVVVDLFDAELTYSDGTYDGEGYKPGTYRLVGYDGGDSVTEAELPLDYGIALDAVSTETVPVHHRDADRGPSVPHLVFTLSNPADGPTYIHPVFYKEKTDTMATVTYSQYGREEEVEVSVVPGLHESVAAHAPVPLSVEERGQEDARFLAPGEKRQYLGPPLGGSHHTIGSAEDPAVSPASLSPSFRVELVGGNTSTRDTPSSASDRQRFAALRDSSISAYAITEYALDLSLSAPEVAGEWAFYADATVDDRTRTATWQRDA